MSIIDMTTIDPTATVTIRSHSLWDLAYVAGNLCDDAPGLQRAVDEAADALGAMSTDSHPIEGTTHRGPGMKEGDNHYAVTFTLFVDAETPDQASDRAMRFNDCINVADDTDAALDKLDFYWHLHDHDGC